MKISYSRFWDNLDIDNNWFNYMFMQYFNDDSIEFSSSHEGSDIIMVNESLNPEELPKGPIKIFYTGESHKNGYSEKDHILLGFDPTSIDKRSFRLPVWYIYLNWWPDKFVPRLIRCGPVTTFDPQKMSTRATEEDVKNFLLREGFACMTIGHFGFEGNRLDAYHNLSTIGSVIGYGDAFARPDYRHKLDILSNYKFNIAFENKISKGYVTAQIPEAKLGGCIPIFWGDLESQKDFNKECYIDYTTMSSMSELVSEVEKIYSSEDLLVEKFSQPLFNSPPSLNPLFEFLDAMGLKG